MDDRRERESVAHVTERYVSKTDSSSHCRELARLAEEWGEAWFYADGFRVSVSDRRIPMLDDVLILRTRGISAKTIFEAVRREIGFGHEPKKGRPTSNGSSE
jgi:hypothetical protein